ncbi:MAG: hypothetical protein ACREQP_07205 [Candidatus Binatia bacterium]
MAGTSFPRVTIGIGNRYDSLYLRNGVVKIEGFEAEQVLHM